MIEVSEADRERAADLFGSTDWSRTQYLTGKNDRKPKVQALAAHRQQAEDAMRERCLSAMQGLMVEVPMAPGCADGASLAFNACMSAIRGIDITKGEG